LFFKNPTVTQYIFVYGNEFSPELFFYFKILHMKNPFKCLSVLSFVFTLYILPAAALAQGQPQKLSKEELDEAAVEQAEEMADQILTKMTEGSYYEFTDENATPQLKQQFDARF